ncbi:hypothetical protein LTR95_008572 [Oleoguttula sp. CCFEE 5521]
MSSPAIFLSTVDNLLCARKAAVTTIQQTCVKTRSSQVAPAAVGPSRHFSRSLLLRQISEATSRVPRKQLDSSSDPTMISQVSKCTLFLLLCCAHQSKGVISYSPNCTLPEPGTNYVAAGNLRSTLDILWTSLATIIACTYSVLHLNVPRQRDGRDPGWKGDLTWGLSGLWSRVKWSIVTVFAPKYYLVSAWEDNHSARSLQRKLANLEVNIHRGRQWSLRECFYIHMGGYAILQRRDSHHRETFHLWHDSFIHLLEQDPASMLPQLLSDDEIADRSKSDLFTKTVILIQICYFCITVFTRWTRQLPVTPLEVVTLAYTTCSMLPYCLFLYRPQGVTTVAIVARYDTKVPDSLSLVLRGELTPLRTSILQPIRNSSYPDNNTPKELQLSVMILWLAGALFGAVHLAAWNSTFPTTIERWLWRAAAIISMIALSPMWLRSLLHDIEGRVDSMMLLGSTSIYVLVRLVLIVEMFRSLGYLPPDAYIATWTSNVPHFG